ncbi:MAG: hypothetical protein EXS25_02280 [Pedosphaera sp.]|nr:hypothetical protein [Pedosphaera sp.]
METSDLTARRATLEDIPALKGLWLNAGLPWDQLESFIGEFIVIPGADQQLLAAIGLMIEFNDALLHSEALAMETEADNLRASLWQRIQIMTRNQGIHRIWTQEDADYWRTCGFIATSVHEKPAESPSFLQSSDGWSLFKLLDTDRAKAFAEKQMGIWQASRSEENAALQRKIRNFRTIAFLIFSVALLLSSIFLWAVIKTNILGRLLR